MADAVLEISTTLARFQAEIAKIPGMTDKAAAAAAVKLATQMGKGSTKAANEAKDAVADVTKETASGIANVAKAGKLAFPAIGGLGERLKGAVEGFGALGPAGVAVGSVMAGAAVAGSIVMAGKALLDFQERAFEATKQLRELERAGVEIVSPTGIAAVEDTHWALEGVGVAADALNVTLAASLAPTMERVLVDTTALLLASEDLVSSWLSQEDVIGGLGDSMAGLARTAGELALNMGRPGIGGALIASAEAWDRYGRKVLAGAEKGLSGLEYAGRDYVAQAEEMILANRKLGDSHKGATKSAKEQKAAELDVARALDEVSKLRPKGQDLTEEQKLTNTFREQLAVLSDLERAYRGVEEVRAAVGEKRLELEKAYLAERDDMRASESAAAVAEGDAFLVERERQLAEQAALEAQYNTARLSMAASLAGSITSISADLARAQGDSELEIFRKQQRGAAIEAGINTALAISEALASAPFPYNIPAVAVASAAGLAQELAIATMEPPAYTGLDVPYASTLGTLVPVHPGESVMDRSEAETYRRQQAEPYTPDVILDGRRMAGAWARNSRRGGVAAAEQRARAGKFGHRSF